MYVYDRDRPERRMNTEYLQALAFFSSMATAGTVLLSKNDEQDMSAFIETDKDRGDS